MQRHKDFQIFLAMSFYSHVWSLMPDRFSMISLEINADKPRTRVNFHQMIVGNDEFDQIFFFWNHSLFRFTTDCFTWLVFNWFLRFVSLRNWVRIRFRRFNCLFTRTVRFLTWSSFLKWNVCCWSNEWQRNEKSLE